MLKYFDDILGKDIGFMVLVNLLFDFSIFTAPFAFPLAILLSSLMTFGNLGEHFELTAIKSAGISLLRAILPIFIIVIAVTVFAFYFNNYFVPKAALNAYSLLYDIKQKKPALDLKEGAFYNGIPDLSIKVAKKDPETGKIWDAIIYDHRDKNGNKKVTLADSGKMYTILNDQYLILELYSGHSYIEGTSNARTVSSRNTRSKAESLSRVKFDMSKIVLDLSSFGMTRTDQDLFAGNRIMRNLSQLTEDVDSLKQDVMEHKLTAYNNTKGSFKYLSEDRFSQSNELMTLVALKDSLQVLKEDREKQRLIEADTLLLKNGEIQGQFKPKEIVVQVISPVPKMNSGKKMLMPDSGISSTLLNKKKLIERQRLSRKVALPNDKKVIQIDRNKRISKNNQQKKTNKGVVEGGGFFKKGKPIDEELQLEKLNNFVVDKGLSKKLLKTTVNRVRQMKSKIQNSASRIEKTDLDRYVFEVQWHKIISNSCACLVMFLIGAPLGAIIKKGGLGFPVLISIFFFIVFYVLGMIGEKQAKLGLIDPLVGVWAANIILLPVGLFFLRQARNDARLFDADFYNVTLQKLKVKFGKKD
jgi:lipopolysaccharide export system permease protein